MTPGGHRASISDNIERKTEFVHGVLVKVWDTGVLILGESLSGKSASALDLILNGHALVADDVIRIDRVQGHLVGSAPERFEGLLEIRGLGIVDVRELFGPGSHLRSCAIDICIGLSGSISCANEPGGLNDAHLTDRIPTFTLAAESGRRSASLVDWAVKLASCERSFDKVYAEHDALLTSTSA